MTRDSSETRPLEDSWGRRRDRLCDDFENAWRGGRQLRIEDYVRDLPEPQRRQLLGSLLDVELKLRLAGGEEPTLDEYERRFPLEAALVRAAFVDAGCPAPEWIDRFRVLRSLGRGGFGRVFLCYDDKLHRQVALKVPRRDRLSSAEARERFLREARNVAALQHEAIVTLHEFGETDGQCYLVYQYIAGGNLADRLKQSPLSQYQAAKLVERLADALQHAHGEDVYHRDIKPANILLDRRGQPYLTDFGLAVRVEDLADEHGRAGTAPYMAPEIVRGHGDQIDGRADIYSLGVVLYELLTGRRPFDGPRRQDVYGQILSGREPRPPREINPNLHPQLQAICLKAIARSVGERYPTAGDLADQLHGAAERLTQPDAAPQTVLPWPEPPPPPQPSSSPLSVPVLPKGLRPFGPEDRAFFLELLPGPRDAQRLPESVLFWKLRIESADADTAFPVGLMYGPSGCGKSSLVKAGLLPALAPSVLAVYVEATHDNTEERLLGQLRKRCPGLGPRASLHTTLARLRRRGLRAGAKLLVVLDQFEQWLHAHGHDMESTELVAALRQADGEHLQVLLLVRSDFWMSISRLFEALKINLDRAHNTQAVDLFSESHAHHVLHLFGTAYTQLPARQADLSPDQQDFLALAVKELSADGDVIPVRLSLFADMVRNRPWTREEFERVGGTRGVGVKFLEETFTQPDLRGRKVAAQAILQSLLPAPGTDIKGPMRSREDLASAAGLPVTSHAFTQLMESLNREYLITPTDPPTASESSSVESHDQAIRVKRRSYYQLTHDYLVPSLREWLTEEKRKTYKGRAELRLAERAAQWNARRQNRLLPSAWEFVNIRLFTRPRAWADPQRLMMRSASRYYMLRFCALVLVIGLAGWVTFEMRGSIRAQSKVTELVSAPVGEVPEKIKELAPYRRWADSRLSQVAHDPTGDPRKRRNANLALLPAGAADVSFLIESALTGDPDEVRIVGKTLLEHQFAPAEVFWHVLEDPRADPDRRLRAAAALAAYNPRDPRWQNVSRTLADKLLVEFLAGWGKELEPIGMHLVQPLVEVVSDPKRADVERSVAANLLADYARDLPGTLAELVKSTDVRHAPVLLRPLMKHKEEAAASMDAELDRTLVPIWNDLPLDPAWRTPDSALTRKLEAAHGLVSERYALCQTMRLGEFLATADALRASGYRPACFRPYAVADTILVAAIWTRDGRSWQLADDLPASELRRQEAVQRQKGFLPLDVASYVTHGSERYAVLWTMPDAHVADAKLDVELSEQQFPAVWQQMQKAGFVPHTQIVTRTGNQPHHTVIWYKPTKPADNIFFGAGKDRAWYESHLTPSELLTDARLSPQKPWGGYSAVWHSSADLVSAESHDLDPIRHLDRCRQFMKEGYRPVSISVLSLQAAPPVAADPHFPAAVSSFPTSPPGTLAASVWHRPVVPEAAKDALAKRQARAAVTLLRLGQPGRLWPLLRFRPDPGVRTYVIHLLRPFGTDPQLLVGRLHEEQDVSARRALLLALGEFRADSLPGVTREQLIAELRQRFRDDPDPGIHSSVAWLLHRWGQESRVAQSEKELVSRQPTAGRRWYVNAEGQTMAIVLGPAEFWMGSPGCEPGRIAVEEDLHRARIPHSFAIATTEVTTRQFKRFLDANPKIRERLTRFLGKEEEPIAYIDWQEAAQYCRWLSEQEKIPEEQMCYPPLEQIKPGMQLPPDGEARTGYRLPTEKEWEYACRAGSITSRSFGDGSEMLVNYGWYLANSDQHAWPVGQLKPNDFGLFDMHGNVAEWCQDQVPGASYRLKRTESSAAQRGAREAAETAFYAWRGGGFSTSAARVRSAAVFELIWGSRGGTIGFRVARTMR